MKNLNRYKVIAERYLTTEEARSLTRMGFTLSLISIGKNRDTYLILAPMPEPHITRFDYAPSR